MSSTGTAVQVAQFLNNLALAWKHAASYPAGHPILVNSLRSLNEQLAALRGPAGEVVLGVGVDGVLYGTLKIDSTPAQKLAQALYTRGVAFVRFGAETTSADIEAFLRVLSSGSRGQDDTIWGRLTTAGVMSINLEPVNYAAIELTDDIGQKPEKRGESLWNEVLRALMEGRSFSALDRDQPAVTSADELWQMVAKYFITSSAEPFDPEATFGVRIPIRKRQEEVFTLFAESVGNYVSQASARGKQNSIEQALQLLRTLPDPLQGMVLRSVINVLANDETSAYLRDFTSALPNDDVLDALRYLSTMGNLSPHATSLLQSLSAVRASSQALSIAAASPQAIASLVQLFGEEDVSRYNPAEHQSLLAEITIQVPKLPPAMGLERTGNSDASAANLEILRRCADTVLELLTDTSNSSSPQPAIARLGSIFDAFIKAAAFRDALELIQQAQQVATTEGLRAIDDLFMTLATERLQVLIDLLPDATNEQTPAIRQLITALGDRGVRGLLTALAEENNRSRRRRLFDLTASLGPSIIPEVTKLLDDGRWFVLRNMIQLLRAVGDRTSLPRVRELARHPDLRVKLESIKSLFALDRSEMPADLLIHVINDPDPKAAEMAIDLVGNFGIKEAAGPLLRILDGRDITGSRRQIRLKALYALGELGEPGALPELQRFLESSFLPWPARAERYAAWQALKGYAADVRRPFVEKGLKSRDPNVRAIAAELKRS